MGIFRQILIISAAIAGSAAYAQPAAPLSYKDAMRCGALHGFYMTITPETEAAYTKHEDVAARWLTLAMARDGNNGARAREEYQPVLEGLIDRLNSLENDPSQLESVLISAFQTCEDLQVINTEEFDAAEVE